MALVQKQQKCIPIIADAFSMIQEEILLQQLKLKSARAYDYVEKIPMEHWHNMQWITMWKYPPQHRLPPQYGGDF